jgi:hypothetical protein
VSGLLDRFTRARKGLPCPVCEHQDWCLLEVGAGGEPISALCQRIESTRRWKNAGWFHDLQPDSWRSRPRRPQPITVEPRRNFGPLSREMEAGLTPTVLNEFAAFLGVAPESLTRIRMGLARGAGTEKLGLKNERFAFTFPMVDDRERAIGLRIRLRNNRKLCVTGSASGLFVPFDLTCDSTVFIAEGETDTAALLTLGVHAIGRPGAKTCVELCARFVRHRTIQDVVVVADQGTAGQQGARHLAGQLALIAKRVRVVTPPSKDVRQWLRGGATAVDLACLVEAAHPLRRGAAKPGGAV